MQEIQVALIHGRHLIREGIAHILREGKITVVATAENFQTLLSLPIDVSGIDVFIVAATSNGCAMADVVAPIRSNCPSGKIIILADGNCTGAVLAEAYAAGAAALVTTDTSSAALVEHVRLGALGVRAFPAPPSMAVGEGGLGGGRLAFNGHLRQDFSEREQDILRCLAAGNSNKCIARNLSITESTVKAHVRSILRKLGAENRTQAAIWATSAVSEGSRPSDR